MKSKFVNTKFPPFFQFSRLFTVFPPFFNFPAFFGSSYHDVNNWRYEFNFTTTAHHASVKVCTCMFLNIRKSMVKTRKSHLTRFFPNECARILTTCRERARTTCRERLNEWSMRRVSQKHTIGSGKGSFPNFLENTLKVLLTWRASHIRINPKKLTQPINTIRHHS